ncbi:MAG: hypothetical protein IPP35_04400 [Elusimicrobia bacterium]|nr:hypothetical protein [Elusimicrobiota bacterium]
MAQTGRTLGQKIKRSLIKWSLMACGLAVLGIALWAWGALRFVYSSGERAGFVQKFSKRGWIFKTWEGELAMVNLPGAMPEIFFFTVRDEKVVPSIEGTMGQRVVLSYDQHRGVPPKIFGETSYYVVRVRAVGEEGASPAPPVPAPPAGPTL